MIISAGTTGADSVVQPIGIGGRLMYRANLQRTGVYQTQALIALHGVKWRFNSGHLHVSPPIVVDDWLYFGSVDDNLSGSFYALDAQTGQARWKLTPGGGSSDIDGDSIYCTGGVYSKAVGLDRTTG
jgi:glucose dehydrogenase